MEKKIKKEKVDFQIQNLRESNLGKVIYNPIYYIVTRQVHEKIYTFYRNKMHFITFMQKYVTVVVKIHKY